MAREGKVRTQAGVCLNVALLPPPPPQSPILFTCSNTFKGALCARVYEVGGQGDYKKGTAVTPPPSGGTEKTTDQKKVHKTSAFGSPHTVQTCPAKPGSLSPCAFCCWALRLGGRCRNSPTRNSVPTPNAVVSSSHNKTPVSFCQWLLLWVHCNRIVFWNRFALQNESLFLHRSDLDSPGSAGLLPWRLQVHPHQTGPACLCLCNAEGQREPLLGWQCKRKAAIFEIMSNVLKQNQMPQRSSINFCWCVLSGTRLLLWTAGGSPRPLPQQRSGGDSSSHTSQHRSQDYCGWTHIYIHTAVFCDAFSWLSASFLFPEMGLLLQLMERTYN